MLPNGFEQIAFAFACFQSGMYYTPVNWHLVGPEIAYIVNDSETKVLVVDERFAGEAVRVLDEISSSRLASLCDWGRRWLSPTCRTDRRAAVNAAR